MKPKRKRNTTAVTWLISLLVLMIGLEFQWDGTAMARESSRTSVRSAQGTSSGQIHGQEMLAEELLGDIDIPVSKPTRDFVDQLYHRHRSEFTRLIQDNPQLVWDALDIVVDALPALRAIPQNGGQLYLDRSVYARASDLVDRCEGLSTPELARDLKKLRLLVEMKTKSADSERVRIDLNE